MTDDEAVATASIGLQLYVEVPKDPRYKSEVLVKRGADSVAQEKVPVRLVAGRWDLFLLFHFYLSSGKTCFALLPGLPS